jgi:hypothetical protein
VHALDRAPADMAIFRPDETTEQSLTGKVMARGLSDERAGAHYVIVDGVDGRVHYAEVPDDTDSAVATGAIVRIGSPARTIREVDRTVEAVAQRNQGIYSPENHRAFDPRARPEFIEAHVRRLEALRRLGKLVERHPDGRWSIPDGHAERGASFDQSEAQGRIAVLSPLPPNKLVQARASTWLDQELLADKPTPAHDSGFGQEVRKALRQRRAWLIEQGLARKESGWVIFRRDMLSDLQGQELAEAGAAYAKSSGKRYVPAGGQIEGIYREPVQLVSGKFAVVEKARDFTLVPWSAILERRVGRSVEGVVRGDHVNWTIGRSRGISIS